MALRDSNIEGGSGYASATVRDLGFPDEKTNGVVGSGEPVTKKKELASPRQLVEPFWVWQKSLLILEVILLCQNHMLKLLLPLAKKSFNRLL